MPEGTGAKLGARFAQNTGEPCVCVDICICIGAVAVQPSLLCTNMCICTCVIGAPRGELTTEVLEADSTAMALDLVHIFWFCIHFKPFLILHHGIRRKQVLLEVSVTTTKEMSHFACLWLQGHPLLEHTAD